jgi:hypothetical protein
MDFYLVRFVEYLLGALGFGAVVQRKFKQLHQGKGARIRVTTHSPRTLLWCESN